jgi:hypothetical protein
MLFPDSQAPPNSTHTLDGKVEGREACKVWTKKKMVGPSDHSGSPCEAGRAIACRSFLRPRGGARNGDTQVHGATDRDITTARSLLSASAPELFVLSKTTER